MADTTATSPLTASQDDTVGTVLWNNIDNCKLEDGAFATIFTVTAGHEQ